VGEQDRGGQVQRDLREHLGLRDGLQSPGADVAGVVDQHVEVAERLERRCGNSVSTAGFGEVGRGDVRLCAGFPNQRRYLLRRLRTAPDQGQPRADGGELQCRAATAAAAGAGEQDRAVVQVYG